MKKFLCLLLSLAILEFVYAERRIVVNKQKCELTLIDGVDTIFRAPVCLGVNYGQKTKAGDHKTPEGDFEIAKIQNSTKWLYYPSKGSKGIPNCYGPWFLRLKTPMSTHIGIHGTSKPESVGKRESEGCVRMKNSDIVKLKELVHTGMKVTITADPVSKTKKKK